jgi:hypothetical protein
MPKKHTLTSRFLRMKNGITSHMAELPAELQALLKIDEFMATGDQFMAEYEKEAAARGQIDPARAERMAEALDLKIAYNLCKNLTEAYVGEHKKDDLERFIKTGKYIEKAIYLRNALRENEEVLTKVGEHNLEELEKAIAEYQDAVALETATEESLDGADEASDKLVVPLNKMLNTARMYIKAWLYSIDRPELYAEFVKPRVVVKKKSEAGE